MIRNLLPDPKPFSVSAWTESGECSISRTVVTDGWMELSNNINRADSSIFTRIVLPPGSWRYGAELDGAITGYASNVLRFIRLNPVVEMRAARWDGTRCRIVTPTNVLTAASPVELRLMVGSSAGDTVKVRRLFVMSDEAYRSMQASGLDWFCGGTLMPGAAI